MLIRGKHHFRQIFAQEWFAAGEGQINRSAPDVLKHARPFIEREVVVGLAPHIARAAFAIAPKRNANDDAERQQFRKTETIEGPVERDFGEERE
jgi:hypothetical protein